MNLKGVRTWLGMIVKAHLSRTAEGTLTAVRGSAWLSCVDRVFQGRRDFELGRLFLCKYCASFLGVLARARFRASSFSKTVSPLCGQVRKVNDKKWVLPVLLSRT